MSEKLRMALEYAELKHKGQVDKASVPYIEHPKAVASRVDGEDAKIVALLHDTVEDTDATVDEIREMFGDTIACAVACLTHDKEVPYLEYVKRLKGNELARIVKLADLDHNSDLSRLPEVSEKDFDRVEKYKKAIRILSE